MRKRTEKEELINQSFQLLNISKLIEKQGVQFSDFCDDIPGVLHTNKLDEFWLTNANKKTFSDFNIEKEDLEKFGEKVLVDRVHPNTVKTLAEANRLWRENNPDGICESFQYIRKDVGHTYKWYFSVKKKISDSEFVALIQPVDKFTFASNTLDKLFKRQPWLESKAPLFQRLSPREVEIMHLAADGYTTYQISEILVISLHTVKTHRKNLWNKLEVKSIAELVRIADFYLQVRM